ncbi:Transmembrane protein 63C [Phytophthora boehmeriae]|uniref:Transmembrane protein 63C n=1 Tax=Phytophthora boehmeriae TaxID=109152 RepID=A0A8T1XDE0_9STRA|nr:Transmembrane protein 63C [Phytophthora boehmeriae]
MTEISMIPREFFVIETNEVVIPQQYPPSQYKSSLNAQGYWETVVFPALTPHTRQQVVYLRQTLDKMRAVIPQFDEINGSTHPETEPVDPANVERRRLLMEYTTQETQIYSFCFHELARQINIICKEQGELLHEIRERYDAVVSRLIDQVELLQRQTSQQQDQLDELVAKQNNALDENNCLVQRIKELEQQVKAGPSITEAQDSRRRRSMLKERGKRQKEMLDSGSDNDIGDEEAEWRRQRNTSSVARRHSDGKNDSAKELHLAASRLQFAFQKYQARKEQTRVTIRVEKQAAAMDIQRSYRGFRDRQVALHRRAIMRTIMRRREENAAVELLQANVRAYLLDRRRSAKLKASDANPDDSKLTQGICALPVLEETTSAAVVIASPSNNTASVDITKTEALDTKDAEEQPNAKQALKKLLSTFRELASVITRFRHGGSTHHEEEDVPAIKHDAIYVKNKSTAALLMHTSSANSTESLDEEDFELFQQTMQEAQALVGSLHVVLGTVPEDNTLHGDTELPVTASITEPDSDEISASTGLLESFDQHMHKDEDDYAAGELDTNKKLEDVDLDEYDTDSISIPFGERAAMALQNYVELHLDDSLWSSGTYHPASRQDMAEADARLAIALSSWDQRKRLVSLKQLISDIYDTIVGKIRELPPRRIADTIASRCHLSLSFSEWRQQRSQICSRAVGADQPRELVMPINVNIDELTREHFRCKWGLKQLTDAALASMHESINDFAGIDHDVKRFQEFLEKERSEEELVFCCMCRYLCANEVNSEDSPAPTLTHRRPVFHPVTMREIIDVSNALELAKLLFRVGDESFIVESDMPFTEVENAVYQQYLPTNGYHQFESIVSSFFIDADSQTASMAPMPEGQNWDNEVSPNNCRRPTESPRRVSSLARPTNFNQFHVKQYNSQAPRSPVVRHQRQRASQVYTFADNDQAGEPKWIYFEELLALLIKYRGEMNHFHLFSYWVQELFALAARSTTDAGSQIRVMREHELPPNEPKLLDDAAFVETLAPLSLGPTDRELKNIFHNSLRQRKLQLYMPLRVFTSVTLLLLRNGLLSVSSYAPLQNNRSLFSHDGDSRTSTRTRQRSRSIREQDEDREWRTLALKWRTQESAFEAAIEAIYYDPPPSSAPSDGDQIGQARDNESHDSTSRSAHALQLLQLRQELYDLFASRAAKIHVVNVPSGVTTVPLDGRVEQQVDCWVPPDAPPMFVELSLTDANGTELGSLVSPRTLVFMHATDAKQSQRQKHKFTLFGHDQGRFYLAYSLSGRNVDQYYRLSSDSSVVLVSAGRDQGWQGIWMQFLFNFILFLGGMAFFAWQRIHSVNLPFWKGHQERLFQRGNYDSLSPRAFATKYGELQGDTIKHRMKKFWSISAGGDYMSSACGIPAALIVHFYTDCGHLFAIFSLFSLAAMLPVNYWPGNARGKKGGGDTYQETTFSNVPLHSDWYWAHVVYCYVIAFGVLVLLLRQRDLASALRKRAKHIVGARSVFIQHGLPLDTTSQSLRTALSTVIPRGGSIHEVTILQDLTAVHELLQRRRELSEELSRILALDEAYENGTLSCNLLCCPGSVAVPNPLEHSPGAKAKRDSRSDSQVDTLYESLVDDSTVEAYDKTSARQIFALREELDFFPEDAFDEFAKRHCMGSAFIIFDSTATRNAFVRVVRGQTCIGRIVNTVEALSRRGFREKPLSGLMRPEPSSSESLDPMLQSLKLRSAPEPDDVIWQNLAYQPYTVRRAIVFCLRQLATIALLLLFSTPTAVLMFIKLDSSSDIYHDLDRKNTVLLTMIASYLPALLLIAVNWCLLAFLYHLSMSEPSISESYRVKGFLIKGFTYLVVSSVILPSIGVTAVYLALSRIEQSGGRSYIESFLYKVSGTFFISYVCQRAFLGAIVDITRCADLVAAQPWIHSRSVTDVEVQRALRPNAFSYGHDYALVLSIFLVVLLGTVITPVITPIGALYFYLKSTTTKYNMLYVLPYSPGRGHIASTAYWLTFVCLVIFEVVMSFVFLQVAGRKHFVAMIVLLGTTCAVYFSQLSGTEAIALVQQGFADLRGDSGPIEYKPIPTSESGDTEYKSITATPPTGFRRTLLGLSRRSIFGPKPTDLQQETALIASYADPYKAALSIFKLLGVNQFHQMTSTRTQLRYAFIRLRRWSQRPMPLPEPKKKKWWQRKEKGTADKERGIRGWWRRHHKDKHDSL